MIKKRLVRLLDDSKKYIIQNVLWQWMGLLFQIGAVGAAGILLEHVAEGTLTEGILFLSAAAAVSSAGVRFFCEKQSAKASFLASVDVKRVLREKIYEKL